LGEQEIREDGEEKSRDLLSPFLIWEDVYYVVRFGEGAVCFYLSIIATGIVMQLRLIPHEKSEITVLSFFRRSLLFSEFSTRVAVICHS
jgi:hypothetical protein